MNNSIVEIKSVAITEGKAASEATTVSGYASVKNIRDSVGDVIVDGAYQRLDESKNLGFTCINHNHSDLPVGYITELKEDPIGLYFEAKFHSTEDGKQAFTVIKERLEAGLFVGMSIGYKTEKASYGEQDGMSVRFLEEIFVRELTFTLLPANDAATVTGVKSRADEYESVRNAITQYVERIASIKTLGRGESWTETAVAELDAIKSDLTMLETAMNDLRATEEKSEVLAEETESDRGADTSILELARAKANATLVME